VSFLTSSSALRLCVWLFDDAQLEIFNFYQKLLFAFRTVQWEIYQFCVGPYLYAGFVAANWTTQPFTLIH